VAVLAAVGVLVTGCSSDDEDSGGVADPASLERTASDEEGLFADEPTSSERPLGDDSGRSGGDAEDQFDLDAPVVEPPAGGEAPAATEAPAGTEAPSEATAEAAADEAATESSATDSDGGLFGSETAPPTDEGDEARFEDNTFRDYGYRDFVLAGDDPMSTFALDVDTGSYTVTRRWLDEGSLPPIESVRPGSTSTPSTTTTGLLDAGSTSRSTEARHRSTTTTTWSGWESRARSSRTRTGARRRSPSSSTHPARWTATIDSGS
jgi:Ca-activated chloride channel family protein